MADPRKRYTVPPPPPGHLWHIDLAWRYGEPELVLLGPPNWRGKRKRLGRTLIMTFRTHGDPEAIQHEVDEAANFVLERVAEREAIRAAAESLVGTYPEGDQ